MELVGVKVVLQLLDDCPNAGLRKVLSRAATAERRKGEIGIGLRQDRVTHESLLS